MKTLFIALILLVGSFMASYSQKYTDVVYLKNGSIIKGTIIEQVPDKQIKIQTRDGSIFVYKMDEIEKLSKELDHPDFNDYGGKYSFGVAIAGGGILGIPVRYYLNPKTAFEMGAYYRPIIVIYSDLNNYTTYNGLMLAGGTNIYLKQH